MRIRELHLTDVTRYEKLDVELPGGIVLIMGDNATGKTTILDIISYALTKQCARTGKAGQNADRMIRTGQNKAEVMLTIQNGDRGNMTLSRTIPGELFVTGQAGNAGELQKYVNDYIGIEAGVLATALSTPAFVEMKASEQKSLLLRLIPDLSFDASSIQTTVFAEVTDENQDAAIEILQAVPTDKYTGDADTFPKLYKYFFDLRASVKKQLKDMGVESEKPVASEESAAALQARVDALHEKRIEVIETARLREEGLKHQEALKIEVEEQKKRVENAGDPETARGKLADINAKYSEIALDLGNQKGKAKGLCDAVNAIESAEFCPLAEPGLLKCAMTEAERDHVSTDLMDKVALINAVIKQDEEDLGKMQATIDQLREEEKKEDKEKLLEYIAAREDELIHIVIPEVGEENEKDIAEEIRKLQELIAEVHRANGAMESYQKESERRADLNSKRNALEELVAILSPKGLPGRILAQVMGPFQQTANERLRDLTGGHYELRVQHEPDFDIILTIDGEREVNFSGLSSSEKLRVGIVMQDVIARMVGLKFLVVDNADILDETNRKMLFDTLFKMPDYDQIIVLCMGEARVRSGCTVFTLRDGRLEEVN